MSQPILPFHRPFGITHPLGIPRPIDVDDFFGAKVEYFALNLMPVPTGCLAHFDTSVYRPYLGEVVRWLGEAEFGWSGPALAGDPLRYCLLRDGAPTAVPGDLRDEFPNPPEVELEGIFLHFDRHHAGVPALQLLDLLTLINEDLGAARFAAVTAGRTWVREFLR